MKKQVKILSVVLIVMMVLVSFSSTIFASDLSDQIKNMGEGNPGTKTDEIFNLGKTIVTILQAVGVVVAVVVILVIGIKYMMGSAQEKAEYKKTMIPYVVGAVLIFGATTIVNVVYNLASGINA